LIETPRPSACSFHAEEVDGGAFAGVLAALFADFSDTGNDIGDVVEELIGMAEIDPGGLQPRGIFIVGAGQDAAHLGGCSVERRALQTVAGEEACFVASAGSQVLTHVVDLAFDHHHACVAQLERSLDACGSRDRGDVEADPISERHQEHRRHVGGPGRKGAMRAGLSTPDGSVIHARQIVEDERGRVRKLDAAGRRHDALQRIVAKDLPRGDGNKSAPAMAAAKRCIAGGTGDIGVWSLGKKLGEEIFHRAAHVRLGGIEVHGGNRPRQNGACHARLPRPKAG